MNDAQTTSLRFLAVACSFNTTNAKLASAAAQMKSLPSITQTLPATSKYPATILQLADHALNSALNRNSSDNACLIHDLIAVSETMQLNGSKSTAILANQPTLVFENPHVLLGAMMIPSLLQLLVRAQQMNWSRSNVFEMNRSRSNVFESREAAEALSCLLLRSAQYCNWCVGKAARTWLPTMRFRTLNDEACHSAVRLLSHHDRETRIAACLFVAQHIDIVVSKVDGIYQQLEELLDDPDPRIQRLAIEILDSLQVGSSVLARIVSRVCSSTVRIGWALDDPSPDSSYICVEGKTSFRTIRPKVTAFDLIHFGPDEDDFIDLRSRCFDILTRLQDYELDEYSRIALVDGLLVQATDAGFFAVPPNLLSNTLKPRDLALERFRSNRCGQGLPLFAESVTRDNSNNATSFRLLSKPLILPLAKAIAAIPTSNVVDPDDDPDETTIWTDLMSAVYSQLVENERVVEMVSDRTHPLYRDLMGLAWTRFQAAGYESPEDLIDAFVRDKLYKNKLLKNFESVPSPEKFAKGLGSFTATAFKNNAIDYMRAVKRMRRKEISGMSDAKVKQLVDTASDDSIRSFVELAIAQEDEDERERERQLLHDFLEQTTQELRAFYEDRCKRGLSLKEIGNGNANTGSTLNRRFTRHLKAYLSNRIQPPE